jgi:glycosyltransferase involved in cell wall biosynthesis
MRNEERSIGPCLASIAAQVYPAERLEVLVYDGASTDGSVAIATELCEGRPNWTVLPNRARIQAAAWNAGIATARGDVIGIVSGHVELASDYVDRAVAALERSGAAMVGGPVRAEGMGTIGRAIAVATSSRFGIGDAAHHYTDREIEVDSVFMGVCRAETYRLHRFDEAMVRNQDDELSYRIRKAGGRIVCDPAIQSTYRSRASLGGLWRQYTAYGFWKVQVLRRHPRQMRLRQFVPPALVLAILAGILALATPIGGVPLFAVLAAYLGAAVVAAVLAGGPMAPQERAVLPIVFACMHLAYGLGFLAALPPRPAPSSRTDPDGTDRRGP